MKMFITYKNLCIYHSDLTDDNALMYLIQIFSLSEMKFYR